MDALQISKPQYGIFKSAYASAVNCLFNYGGLISSFVGGVALADSNHLVLNGGLREGFIAGAALGVFGPAISSNIVQRAKGILDNHSRKVYTATEEFGGFQIGRNFCAGIARSCPGIWLSALHGLSGTGSDDDEYAAKCIREPFFIAYSEPRHRQSGVHAVAATYAPRNFQRLCPGSNRARHHRRRMCMACIAVLCCPACQRTPLGNCFRSAVVRDHGHHGVNCRPDF